MHVLPRAALLLFLAAAGAKAQVAGSRAGTGGAAPGERASAGDSARVGHALPGSSPDCATGLISYIFIDNHSIFDATDASLPQRFDWAYRTANSLHVRTRQGVIRRELLFHTGDCYDPARVDESARLLRGFDFVSRADLYGVKQPDGSYHVVVETWDEWTTGLGLRVNIDHGLGLRGVRVRERNVAGSGQTAELWYLDQDLRRDYGVTWQNPQLGASRWDLAASLGRTRAGTVAWQTLQYPFLGETGRWAGRQSFGHADQLFEIVEGNDPDKRDIVVPVRDETFDVALVGRLGKPGNLTLFGGGLAYRKRSFPGQLDELADHDWSTRAPADSATTAPVRPQLQPRDNARAVLLLGQRNIWWTQRRGYDSPWGQQDIPLGAELSLALSRSLPGIGHDDNLGGTITFYSGLDAGPALVVLRARGDGLRDFKAAVGAPAWNELYAESELLTYLRFPALPGSTLVLRAASAGGWETRSPFQVTLGGDNAVRGYDPHLYPGGRRVVFTGEDRLFFGDFARGRSWPFPEVFDLGATVFADVGRVWPGDAPFGLDSGWKGSVGAGLRAAFPAGGRVTYRADVAVPLDGSLRRARFLLSVGEVIGLSRRRGNGQIDRSRPQGLSGDLFSFPR